MKTIIEPFKIKSVEPLRFISRKEREAILKKAGYNIEYSGLKFGMFFVAEFLHAFTISALTATLFLGG